MWINSRNISILFAALFLGYRIAFNVMQRPLLVPNNTGLSEQSKIVLQNYEIQILNLAENISTTFFHSSVSNFFVIFFCVLAY